MSEDDEFVISNELSRMDVDLIHSYLSEVSYWAQGISRERVEDNGRLGLGLGGNYFFTRHLGLGADAYTENTQHSFVDNTSGNLILRFPFDKIHLAP